MPDFSALFSIQVSILDTFLRGTAIYLGLFFLLRFCLRRQSSDLGVSDLLVIVLIGDAFQNGMAPEDQTIGDSFLLVATVLFWAFALDWLGHRVPWIERFLRAREVLLVKDGKLIRRNMKKELVTMDELMAQVRLAGIEDLAQVRLAHIEGDGKFSIIPYGGSGGGQRPKMRSGV